MAEEKNSDKCSKNIKLPRESIEAHFGTFDILINIDRNKWENADRLLIRRMHMFKIYMFIIG